MTPKQITIDIINRYWEILFIPGALMLQRWWMTNRAGYKKISLTIGGDEPTTEQFNESKMIDIVATQTKILAKIDEDIERLQSLTVGMKEEDARVRDSFTKCLGKISEGTDALVGMFKEYRAYERGRESAHA